jgi:hypothetical protein
VGVFPVGGDPAELGKELSRHLQSVVLSFNVYDGDYLQYWLARDGSLIDEFNSCPDYFGEPVSSVERKRVRGNAATLASACGRESAHGRLRSLLADPPNDAVAVLDEIGELLQIPDVLLRHDYLSDPSLSSTVSDLDLYYPIGEDEVREARRTAPGGGSLSPTDQRGELMSRHELLMARLEKAVAAEAKRHARLEKSRDPEFGADYPAIHPNVIGSVVSFADFATSAGRRRLVDAFSLMRSVLEPLVPRGFPLQWEYVFRYRGELSSKTFRSSKARDAEMLRIMESDEIRRLELRAQQYGPVVMGCEITPVRPGQPTTIEFSYDPKCVCRTGVVMPEWQEKTVDLVRELTVRSQAACGYLTLEEDNISGSTCGTPYEYLVGAFRDEQFVRLRTSYRGYFWGNILGPGHIERLGGLESVLTKAPCPCVPFPNSSGPWVYLQVSDDINSFGDDALRQLRAFLAPILPSGPMDTLQDRHRFRLLYD